MIIINAFVPINSVLLLYKSYKSLQYYCTNPKLVLHKYCNHFSAHIIKANLPKKFYEFMEAKKFEITFAKIYPDFTRKLVQVRDDLSPQEVKVCMCIKMSFSNTQIQEHLKISKSTLANLRSSIRHKLGLERSKSLTNAILCI